MVLRYWGNWVAGVIGLLLLAGCHIPSQMFWAADGSHAGYVGNGAVAVVDEQGKRIAELGPSTGGVAWAADSKTMYYAVNVEDPSADHPGFHIHNSWLANPEDGPTTQPVEKVMAVRTWSDGQVAELFRIPGHVVAHLSLSPDQKWVAVIASTDPDEGYQLYVYSMDSRTLYPVSVRCGMGMCFTGLRRLAYIEPDGLKEDIGHVTGKIVEATLDDATERLERLTLLDAVPAQTPWLVGIDEDILLTAVSRSFPGKPMANDVPYKLYHWSRADRSVTAIADDVGPLFMTSPDGKRILFEKITSQTTAVPRKRELAIINANGSDAHVLRDLSVFGNHYDLPMFPMWRNNEEIAFIPALNPNKLPASGAEGRLHFDVVLYRLTSEFTLEPVRILSEGWTESTKPGMDKKDLNVATTTQPVTSTQSNPQPPAANGP